MIKQRLLSPAYKHVRFLMLVYDEVIKISQTEEYRHKSPAKINALTGFKVPDFILQKMKIFFQELSLRSQSFLVNSQLMTNASSTSTAQHQFARPKSYLSSSHATLSALLSSSSSISSISSDNVGVSVPFNFYTETLTDSKE